MKREQYVTNIMLDLGVPAHLRGYRYLREAVLMSMEDMELVGSVTKLLYPEIAKKFHATDQKVERGGTHVHGRYGTGRKRDKTPVSRNCKEISCHRPESGTGNP